MKKIINLLIILKVTSSFISHDTGVAQTIDGSVQCLNGYSKTLTIPFSNTFQNIPQVFFTHELFDQELAETEFKLSITAITTTSFTVQVSCNARRVFQQFLRWYAIDDQRIEVISNFNMANPDDKSFSINNPNAQIGFVVVTSFHYTGPIDFLLQISQITTNSVTVSITKVAGKFTNLKQVGYFVVVGIQEAFINLGLQTITGAFNSGALPIQPNSYFGIALQGLSYPNVNNMRIRTIYTNTTTTISYSWGTYLNSKQPLLDLDCILIYCKCENNKMIKQQLNSTSSYKPLECFTIRASRKLVFNLNILPTFNLELVQCNSIYTTNGNYNYVVNKLITPLKMNIQVKCESGMKIQADFNKCNSCSIKKTHSFQYNCFNSLNYVGFFPQFQQAFPQYNHLKINIQSFQLEVINVVYDQTITEYTIVKIQILSQ